MEWFAVLLAIIFVVVCLIIIFIVLIQPGQSEGLAGTFGSGGMLSSALGVHMKNRLAKLTTILVIIFFVVIFTFAMAFRGEHTESDELMQDSGVLGPGEKDKPAEEPAPAPLPTAMPAPEVEAVPAGEVPAGTEAAPAPAPESSEEDHTGHDHE